MMRSPTQPPMRAIGSFITAQTPGRVLASPGKAGGPVRSAFPLIPAIIMTSLRPPLRRCALPALILSLLAACGEGGMGNASSTHAGNLVPPTWPIP